MINNNAEARAPDFSDLLINMQGFPRGILNDEVKVKKPDRLIDLIVQYWRSFEHLESYAKDRQGLHYPAWKEFNTKIKSNGDVGIWHETYKVEAGNYECIYNNMPKFGLGKVAGLIPAIGKRESAADRIKSDKP